MMKQLIQQIFIGYYSIKIRTIAIISATRAAKIAFVLFCKPTKSNPNNEPPAIFRMGETLVFKLNQTQIYGWIWRPSSSNGKRILVVHGFNSYCYKFNNYIEQLQHRGFEVLAFDAPAHGLSGGKSINALLYHDMILKINELYGPLYGIMAHSLGGLAASLAAEKMHLLEKLVLIAPATETNTAIHHFFNRLQLPNSLKTKFEEVLVHQAQNPMSYFSISRAIHQIRANTLWLHDIDDPICPFPDASKVQKLNLAHVTFFETKGLGHSNIYKDENVAHRIVSFF